MKFVYLRSLVFQAVARRFSSGYEWLFYGSKSLLVKWIWSRGDVKRQSLENGMRTSPVLALLTWPVSFSEFSRPGNLSSKVTPESPEKGTNIRCQCFRLFHRREVSPAREFGPVLDVVATLDPRPRRKWRFLRKVGDAARYFDPFTRCEMKRGRPRLEVQTARRVNSFGHPIK